MKELLKKYFGYSEFRPLQEEIINNTLEKKDSLVIMPTGGGKSICYQIPALNFEGLTLIISPLISLMKDQVDSLKANGISAEYINSSLAPQELNIIQDKIKRKEVKLLYIAPERLILEEFKIFLSELQISLIAIDESHCISEWWHDFRPDYRNLKSLRILFPDTPIIALTATATEKVRQDIVNQLLLKNPRIFLSSFNRKNLNLMVVKKKKALEKIISLLREYQDESVIIYCFSRKDSENIAQILKNHGFNALPYHAGLDIEIRRNNQELFIKNKVNIIVATIAFGMGINKPDVRLIIHHTFPKTIEGYYQEIGRAGRDGLSSDCILFYSQGDKRKHEFFIDKIEDEFAKTNAKIKLSQVMKYCEDKSCKRRHILKYFGEEFLDSNCGACDSCLSLSKPENEIKDKEIRLDKSQDTKQYDKRLFEKLRALRKRIASQKNIAPFIIFGDVSLREMCIYFPTNKREFLNIKGVGEKKLEDFGNLFMKVIREHLEGSDIASKSIIEDNCRLRSRHLSKNYQKTKELILKKLPIKEIAIIQKVKESRIIYHIDKLADGGEKIDISYLLPSKEILDKIKSAFEKFGIGQLSPIYSYFNGEFSYDKIRLVRSFIKLDAGGIGENLDTNKIIDYYSRLKKIKENYTNAYEPWKQEDDEKLKSLISKNKTISEISQILKRQPSAIRSRLKKQGLIQD